MESSDPGITVRPTGGEDAGDSPPPASRPPSLTRAVAVTYDSQTDSVNSPGTFSMDRIYKPKFSQEERAARRKKMADAVSKADHSERRDAIVRVAKEFGVSGQTVVMACKEHGVEFPEKSGGPPKSKETKKIITKLRRGVAVSQIAEETGLTRARIYAIRARAIKEGELQP